MIALEGTLATNLFFELGLDGVEGEVLPAMLGLELRESEAVLQVTGDLDRITKKKKVISNCYKLLKSLVVGWKGGGCGHAIVNLPCSLLHALARCQPHPRAASSRARAWLCFSFSIRIPARYWNLVVLNRSYGDRRYPESSSGGVEGEETGRVGFVQQRLLRY